MDSQHVDVLIVGAGLSGIGAAHELQERCPSKSLLLLEARDVIGGTWDLFRYPGVRSDSDMYTLGYRFRPWTGAKSLADGPSILQYIRDTAAEAGIDKKIRFHHKVVRAEWSSDEGRWTVDAERTDTGEAVRFTAGFVYNCSGYYRYEAGYTPDFPGIDRFAGQVIHPQHWPESLDYSGKRVLVIGSGATAVTLVPSMADDAAHVTMLQRSPTYVVTVPGQDPIATTIRRYLPEEVAYRVTRWKNVLLSAYIFQYSQRRPQQMRAFIRKMLKRQLPADFDVDTHFNPRYNPWDQRLCAVPDGDLFKSISAGKVSVVTDTIETFTEHGVRLSSGRELTADIVVTATGFTLQMMGGAQLVVDGEPVRLSERMTYKGMMLSDVPNSAFTIGYTNSSWTLKADLVAEYVCRVLNHMDEHGYDVCVAHNDDPSVKQAPLLDFGAGYVQRSVEELPTQGSRWPWKLGMNYLVDAVTLRHGSVDDGVMTFSRTPTTTRSAARRPGPGERRDAPGPLRTPARS
ncbi:MAG: NAD(P)/FAD-dependent oxidoreductase [Polyangiales bacterium]|nr:NAD(P)/FAD-dependent oxidoreductase [Myxococcales bacterium]MCB9661682.1 NAD(P)/FAD-dependent oxidoreductase [Sandaracinaceae bacterium]